MVQIGISKNELKEILNLGKDKKIILTSPTDEMVNPNFIVNYVRDFLIQNEVKK